MWDLQLEKSGQTGQVSAVIKLLMGKEKSVFLQNLNYFTFYIAI